MRSMATRNYARPRPAQSCAYHVQRVKSCPTARPSIFEDIIDIARKPARGMGRTYLKQAKGVWTDEERVELVDHVA